MELRDTDKVGSDWREVDLVNQPITPEIFSVVIDRCREGRYEIIDEEDECYLKIKLT